MKTRPLLIGALLALGIVATAATSARAASTAPSDVKVERAWIRWLPANLPVAGYATIVNDSGGTVRLTGAASPDYGNVMLMHSRLAQDDSTMVPIAYLDVPAHGNATLSPGGYHIMLSHAKRPIKPGDKVPMTLKFADGATLQVDFPVLPANSPGPAAKRQPQPEP